MAASRSGESAGTITQIAIRVGPVVVLLIGIGWFAIRHDASAYAIGSRAIAFHADANKFIDPDQRIRVIDYGLEAGRGLAYDENGGALYFADAWDTIRSCKPERGPDGFIKSCGQEEQFPAINICPAGECESVERGGILLDAEKRLLVVDRHRRRLVVFDLNKGGAIEIFSSGITGEVHDAAIVEPGVVVVGETREDVDDAGHRRQRGYLLQIPQPSAFVTLAQVTRPVGLAYSNISGRLYVADADDHFVRWRYFERDGNTRWKDGGIVWSEPVEDHAESPSLRSMVVVQGQGKDGTEGIFSAGPNGLYLLDPNGRILAKYVITGDISGLALGENGDLFMTIGRRLSVLRTKSRPATPPMSLRLTKPVPPLREGDASQPAPEAPATNTPADR